MTGNEEAPDSHYYPRFSDAEFERRAEATDELMDNAGVDALVIYGDSGLHHHNHAHVQYLSGYFGHGQTYLVTFRAADERDTLLWGVSNHGQFVRETSIVDDIRWCENQPAQLVAERLDEADAVDRVGLVGISSRQDTLIPYGHYRTLETQTKCELEDVTAAFERLRYRKSEAEIEWFRKGAELTDRALETLVEDGRPGMTGYELRALLESVFLAEGGEPFVTFLSSASMTDPQPGEVLPWKDASARRIQVGDVLTTELSASYHGYPGQIHRPIAVGEPPNDIYRDLFEVARDTYDNLIKAVQPGNSAQDVADAMAPIEESEFEIYDVNLHGFGQKLQPPFVGTTGEQSKYWPARESPATENWVFEERQLVTIQPNVVTPDLRYGLQLGTTVVVRRGGPETLHDVPVEFLRMDG